MNDADKVELREYVDAMFREKDRAFDMAADERREHISSQIQQIQAALASANALELERIASVQRALTQSLASAKEAVTKAEIADNERFKAHNGLLEQIRQQADRHALTMAKLVDQMLPREMFQSTIDEWAVWRDVVDRRLDHDMGEKQGVGEFRSTILSVVAVLVAIGTVIAILATSGHP